MSKVKPKRHSPSLDMTAMCDVAFLLLTFFMLTAKFRPQEQVQVTPPTSIAQEKIPDSDLLTILVSPAGRIYMGVDAQPNRLGMLDQMEVKYGFKLTPEQREQFRLSETFGVPTARLGMLMDMPQGDRTENNIKATLGVEAGIPCDSANNELFSWVLYARSYNPKLRILVKGDGNMKYKVMKQIIGTLQTQNINQFNLVTGQENDPRK